MDRKTELSRIVAPDWTLHSLTLLTEPAGSNQYVAVLNRTEGLLPTSLIVRSQKFMRAQPDLGELVAWKDLLAKTARHLAKNAARVARS